MGTTSEKLTYLNTTKGKIKDSINLTGANITNEPFRQYSTKLEDAYIDIINNGTDTLYNNFPKVSGEGTSLTLNNTYQAPMRNLPKGNTSQTGTPTPTSPIPVNVVSGDNSIVVCGKNLLNNEMESGTLDSTGQPSSSSTGVIRTKNYSIVKPSTQYTLSNDKNYACYIYEYDKNYNFITSYTGGAYQTSPKDITTNSNTKYVKVRGISNQSDLSVKYMLNEGNSAITYEPYQGNTYNIDLPMGINLYDFMNNTYNNEGNLTITKLSNGFTFTNNSSNLGRIIFSNATVDSSKNYVISFEIDNPSGKLARLGWSGSSKTVETRATSGKITGVLTGITTSAFSIYIDGNSTITITNLMYYEGTNTSKSYEPYGTTPIELCKIGNYQDQFKKATGKNLAPINLESETYNSLQITNNNNGTFTLLGNPTGSFGRDIATNLTLKAGTYTISANAMPSGLYIALDNEADTQLSNGTLSKTFTLASDTTYTSLGIWFTKNKDYDVTIQLQIEEGSSVTEWQPMNGWYLHKEIGKVVLNGSEGWDISGTEPYYRHRYITNFVYKGDIPQLNLSNYFINASISSSNTTLGFFIVNTGELRIREENMKSVENWKSWLSNNNLILYKVLATPTSEGIPSNLINQLEEFYQAQSKNNQTNISQINNDLGFIISASALKKG